jgi:hypothetical protein
MTVGVVFTTEGACRPTSGPWESARGRSIVNQVSANHCSYPARLIRIVMSVMSARPVFFGHRIEHARHSFLVIVDARH